MSTTTNRWAMVCPKCKERYYWTGPLVPTPAYPNCVRAVPNTTETTTPGTRPADVDEALAIIDEMDDLISEVPEPGQSFAEDVLEKAKSIGRTIERSNSVTGPQMAALENMRDGMARWIRD